LFLDNNDNVASLNWKRPAIGSRRKVLISLKERNDRLFAGRLHIVAVNIQGGFIRMRRTRRAEKAGRRGAVRVFFSPQKGNISVRQLHLPGEGRGEGRETRQPVTSLVNVARRDSGRREGGGQREAEHSLRKRL